jgi:peptidoglycan hydrolase-like protein with peptidoglycan-binding domain
MFRKYRLISLIGLALFCALAFFGLSTTPALAATYTPAPPPPHNAQPAPHNPPAPQNNSCQPGLAFGNQGSSVRQLQMLLNKFGFRGPNGRPLPVTGRFDANTLFAVKQFEARHHLPQNGRIDARHWQLLGQCGR